VRGARRWLIAPILTAVWPCTPHPPGGTLAPGEAPPRKPFDVAEAIYEGEPQAGWREGGTARRDDSAKGPARVRFGDGAWVFDKPRLAGAFGGVAFRVKAPPGEGEFLELGLEATGQDGNFPRVKISPDNRSEAGGGWTQVFVPMDRLNPNNVPFDRLVLRAFRPDVSDPVLLDDIVLTKAVPGPPQAYHVAAGAPAIVRVACEAPATRISPMIYGFGGETDGETWTTSGAIAHRWGGNATTRYNWQTYFSNGASDWFFENRAAGPYTAFFAENEAHHALGALTIPIIGWVAKDATSYSFPVSVFGPQAKTDPWHPDVGNGLRADGTEIPPGPPTRTSVPALPEWAKRWVAAIVADDAKRGTRSVAEYILDNEPMLWNSTHRDVHPEPLGYEELLERTIQYGSAIREADPHALIAGPAEWGWTNYFFSAKDKGHFKQDRWSHGNVPLVEWYLRKLREHEKNTGVRVLDVLDLHYYPQAEKVFSGGANGVDTRTQLLRLRSTRSLWDPDYVDESWIRESIHLLPRMKAWVDQNYPGLGISIGEWNFGGEWDVTGALATAEALGRFAQFGVTSAFYWTMPPAKSVSLQGFVAYRNFDGKGGRFLDFYLPSTAPEGLSAFASRDEEGKHVVVVAINLSQSTAARAKIDLSTCGPIADRQAYEFVQGAPSFAPGPRDKGDGSSSFVSVLPPWSLIVFDVNLVHAPATGVAR
jgi:hypothetical protein